MPLTGSVGSGGNNRVLDVRLVQTILNEWRAQNGLRPIGVDGLSGPETIGAIRVFQQSTTKIVDGRVDSNGASWRSLAAVHNAIVLSFIEAESKRVFDYLDLVIRSSTRTLPPTILSKMNNIRFEMQSIFRTSAGSVLPQSLSDESSSIAFVRPPPVIGLVLVDDVAILIIAIFVILFLFALLIAKPALEEILKQLIILMSKIKELVDEAIEAVKDAARKNLKALQRCKHLLDAIILLGAEILVDLDALKRLPPGDQLGRERAIRALATKLQRFQAMVDEFFLCMGLPTPVLP